MHQQFMQRTLQLAERGRYSCSPNPMVGCVIVLDDKIIAQGWHEKAGEAHAEIKALSALKGSAENATAYINLEPCCYVGHTGACTEALINAKIAHVVVGCLDPNPLIAGKGSNHYE